MLFKKEVKRNPDRLSDVLPWAALVAQGVVLNKDGSFLSCFRFRGPDLDSATKSELISMSARLNNIIKRLGSGWSIYVEARRSRKRDYPNSQFPDHLSFLIEQERRALFEDRSYFDSDYFLSLSFLPPREVARKLSGVFVEKETKEERSYTEVLENFETEIDRIFGLLNGVFPDIQKLSDEDLLTYLHATCSTKAHRVKPPECPMYLDAVLADDNFQTGFKPRLGNKIIQVVGVKGFPGTTLPALLDSLNRLSIEYRWVTRFLPMDSYEASKELEAYRRKWMAGRGGAKGFFSEALTGNSPVLTDPSIDSRVIDAETAMSDVKDGLVSFGYFTTNVVILSEDEARAEVEAKEVERVLNAQGFAAKIEDINAADAWLGTIPGNVRNNVRRPLMSSLNLAHLLPLSAVWVGPESDEHLGGPVLLHALTGGGSRFRFSPTYQDVQHSILLGPTGSGKSCALNFMDLQFLRYPNAQVYAFDKGGSARITTYGVGGSYYELGGGREDLSFQPLREIDDLDEMRWAQEWLIGIIQREGVDIVPSMKEAVWTALKALAETPAEQRTLFTLTVYLQSDELRQALNPYTINGQFGHILDSDKDTLTYGTWQVFEMEHIMQTPTIVPAVLEYLFHRLQKRFTGAPTRIRIDEAWLAFDNEQFATKIRSWLKELRKYNVGVCFATQEIADFEGSPLAATVREACQTKVFLPNVNALNEHSAAFYRGMGLNDREIQILAEAIPKQHYYYRSPLGSRLFDLGLGELALSYCGATSKEAQLEAYKLHKDSNSTEDFNMKYLKKVNIEWAAEILEELCEERQKEVA